MNCMTKLGWMSLGVVLVFTGCSQPQPNPPATQSSPAATRSAFNHQPLNELLTAHVDRDGLVDYAALKNERAKLNQYLTTLGAAQPAQFPNDAERLAFWINAYNAFTLADVLDDIIGKHKSVKEIEKAFFATKKHPVAGEQLTLDEIERKGRDLNDARIHFAVNCASRSCPKLQREAFTGAELEAQLNRAAREFLADSGRGMSYHPSQNVVYLSPIFKWYAADFTATNKVVARVKAETSGAELLEVALKYVPPEVVQYFAEKKPKVDYLEYDWSLNAKEPTT
ncbi:MAG TPA: DUF547 domain-containing protein [Blastocatellia bacterium]|nr:DUF547 domain-containing protein [Blastocatellia bacterium]